MDKNELKNAARELGRKGGLATSKKYGTIHYINMRKKSSGNTHKLIKLDNR